MLSAGASLQAHTTALLPGLRGELEWDHLLLQLLTAGEVLLQRVSILLVLALCLSHASSLQLHVPPMELVGAVQHGFLERTSDGIVFWLCTAALQWCCRSGPFLVYLHAWQCCQLERSQACVREAAVSKQHQSNTREHPAHLLRERAGVAMLRDQIYSTLLGVADASCCFPDAGLQHAPD